MRAIIAGGGTGGHFYPGYVVAKKLEDKKVEVVFAVKKNDISLDILKKQDIAFIEIDMMVLPRNINPFKWAIFFIKLIKSILFSIRVIKDFKPDFIFSTGSYIAFPLAIAGWFKKVDIYIHESNAIYGVGNYISGFFAKTIFLGLPIRSNPFEKKSILVGTPIREIFFEKIDKQEIKKKFLIKDDKLVISCFGGSQGAKNINDAIYYYILKNKTEKKNNIHIIHITGKKNYEEVKKRYESANFLDENITLLDYYENMNEIYEISDLIISRSGASTISEIIHTKKPAILIPLSTAAANHQYENARFLFEKDAAIILKDDENLKENIVKNIDFVLQKNRLDVMKKSFVHIQIKPSESTNKIIEIIIGDSLAASFSLRKIA